MPDDRSIDELAAALSTVTRFCMKCGLSETVPLSESGPVHEGCDYFAAEWVKLSVKEAAALSRIVTLAKALEAEHAEVGRWRKSKFQHFAHSKDEERRDCQTCRLIAAHEAAEKVGK